MHLEHLGGVDMYLIGVDMDLIGVVSLTWLEVEDGRVRRPEGPVGVSFGGRSRVTLRGKVWVGGVASGDGVRLVGVVLFMVSNGGWEAVATSGPRCWG